MNLKNAIITGIVTTLVAAGAVLSINRYRYGAWTQFTDPKKITLEMVNKSVDESKNNLVSLKSKTSDLNSKVSDLKSELDGFKSKTCEFIKSQNDKADAKAKRIAEEKRLAEEKKKKDAEAAKKKAEEAEKARVKALEVENKTLKEKLKKYEPETSGDKA